MNNLLGELAALRETGGTVGKCGTWKAGRDETEFKGMEVIVDRMDHGKDDGPE